MSFFFEKMGDFALPVMPFSVFFIIFASERKSLLCLECEAKDNKFFTNHQNMSLQIIKI